MIKEIKMKKNTIAALLLSVIFMYSSCSSAANKDIGKNNISYSGNIKTEEDTGNKAELYSEKESFPQEIKTEWYSFVLPVGYIARQDGSGEYSGKYQHSIKPVSAERSSEKIIMVSFYLNEDNPKAYKEYIEASTGKKSAISYKMKKIILAGCKSIEIQTVFESKDVPSDIRMNIDSGMYDKITKKSKYYVIPAKKGFYVIRYGNKESEFDKNLAAFEEIAKSFKGNN